MKVKLLTVMAGPNGVVRDGDVVDVADELGASLVMGGYAEEITTEAQRHGEELGKERKEFETTDGPKPTELRKEPAGRRGGKKK